MVMLNSHVVQYMNEMLYCVPLYSLLYRQFILHSLSFELLIDTFLFITTSLH